MSGWGARRACCQKWRPERRIGKSCGTLAVGERWRPRVNTVSNKTSRIIKIRHLNPTCPHPDMILGASPHGRFPALKWPFFMVPFHPSRQSEEGRAGACRDQCPDPIRHLASRGQVATTGQCCFQQNIKNNQDLAP